MTYLHVDTITSQSSKHGGPCGDVVDTERTSSATTVILADGIGSGIRANVAATMAVARLGELMRRGFSQRQAFASLVKTMNASRDGAKPYAAFCVARILGDGESSVLSYDCPPPLFVAPRAASVLTQRIEAIEGAVVGEAHCHLAGGEGLLLVSDGITQAGLGQGLREGWTADGVAEFVGESLDEGVSFAGLSDHVRRRAGVLWRKSAGDDCTVTLACCRKGIIVNILTGPPSSPAFDHETVNRFINREGFKIVCGATTGKIVAAVMGHRLQVLQDDPSMLAPPRYIIDDIDLVTEGAITLNQVYNVLDEDARQFEEDSGVTQLHQLLRVADRVNLTVGVAVNPAGDSIAFRQRGVLGRTKIVPLLAEKLENMGKLVVIDYT